MNTLKSALKSRTVLFALLIAVLSVLQGFVGLLPITPISQMYIGLLISIAVVFLRFITTTPIGEK
jgi:hypothetical protein